MLDRQLRHLKEATLEPIADRLAGRVHPTTLTLAGGIIGISAGLAGSQNLYLTGLALWGVNRLLDGLDGTIARQTGQTSDMGAYLDVLIDHVVYGSIPLLLALATPQSDVLLALAFMLAAFYINGASWMYLSSLLEKRNRGAARRGEMTAVTMPDGLIEGSETVFMYILFFLFPQWLPGLFALMGALVLVTIVQRLIHAQHLLDN